MKTATPEKKGFFLGWMIVAACSFFNFYVGGTYLYGFTSFFNPLKQEFNWTSAETALGFSLQRFLEMLAGPFVGLTFDRIGPRKLILYGTIIGGCGFILMSLINSLLQFYAAFFLVALGMSLGWAGPPMYTVGNWFIRKRSLALSILMTGSALGGLIVPLLVLITDQMGWRICLRAVGVGLWLVGIPLAIFVRHKPEHAGLLPDGDSAPRALSARGDIAVTRKEVSFTLPQTLRTPAFWLITSAYMLSALTVGSMMVLEMPHLENIGISRETAGMAVTFTTLLSLGGRLATGYLGDKVNKRYIIAVSLLLQSLGILIFAGIQKPLHLIPFLLIYGTGYGATIPMRPSIMAEYFGRTHLGAILGFMLSMVAFGGVISPVIAGRFFDIVGNYRGIFAGYALITALGIPLILAAKHPASKEQGA